MEEASMAYKQPPGEAGEAAATVVEDQKPAIKMEETSMADKQPPGEEAAATVVEDDLKPAIKMEETSMADKQPPGEAAAAAMVAEDQKPAIDVAARFPVAEVAESFAFVKELTARLDAFPDVRDGLVDLLVGLGLSGHGGDARAVTSRVAALLCAHPDVLAAFTAFLAGAAKKAAPAEPPLAVSRPRRATARRPSRPLLPPPKEEEEEEPRNGGGGGDPRLLEALAFLDRVSDVAGREVWEKLVEALDAAGGDRGMTAGEIYGAVGAALGLAHGGLLAEFAARFLPGEHEWAAEERRRARNRRRAEARTKAAAADNDDDRKPPRAGEHRQHESSSVHVTLEIVKKRRAGDGDEYAPRATSKKARAAAGEPSCENRAAARVADAGGIRGNNGDKKPRRRGAANGSGVTSAAAAASAAATEERKKQDALSRQFRELWVFYTRYSTLVGTMARAEELLQLAGGGGGFPATVEEMFPRRESREFLAGYYGRRWGAMRAALQEDGGVRAGAALKAVVESLRRKEAEAVAEEAADRRRQDAARAAERIAGLVTDRVRHEQERRRRRKDAGGDGGCAAASGQQACHRR